MKRFIFLFAAIALFMGCTNEEQVTDQASNSKMVLTAQAEPMMYGGSIDGGSLRDAVVVTSPTSNRFYWNSTDVITLLEYHSGGFLGDGNHYGFKYSGESGTELISKGSFTHVTGNGSMSADNYMVVYPEGDYTKQSHLASGKLHYDFPAQTTRSDTYDNFGVTDFMYSQFVLSTNSKFTEIDGSAFTFKHAMSWLQISVMGIPVGETVQSIAVQSNDGIFKGAVELDVSGNVTYTNPVPEIVLTLNDCLTKSASDTFNCWLTINGDIPAGKPIAIVITTDKASYTVQKTSAAFQPNYYYNTTLDVTKAGFTRVVK